jgi:hypothetical protein
MNNTNTSKYIAIFVSLFIVLWLFGGLISQTFFPKRIRMQQTIENQAKEMRDNSSSTPTPNQ